MDARDDLRLLLDQRRELDERIAAHKAESIKAVRELMDATGVTLTDLGGTAAAPRRGRAPSSTGGQKRPVKYRDDKGHTWTGVGVRPTWLRKAMLEGAALESFAVRKDEAQ
jgi:DNA-binding protein H-NS